MRDYKYLNNYNNNENIKVIWSNGETEIFKNMNELKKVLNKVETNENE